MGFEPIRENEDSFFKDNKIAVPSGVRNFVAHGGKSQPTVEKNWISGDTGMGKQTDDRDPDLMTNVENSYDSN